MKKILPSAFWFDPVVEINNAAGVARILRRMSDSSGYLYQFLLVFAQVTILATTALAYPEIKHSDAGPLTWFSNSGHSANARAAGYFTGNDAEPNNFYAPCSPVPSEPTVGAKVIRVAIFVVYGAILAAFLLFAFLGRHKDKAEDAGSPASQLAKRDRSAIWRSEVIRSVSGRTSDATNRFSQ